ncbi:hypothetical protein FOCC_FOCC011874 [Frankliniella occidentalis]|uniref:Target of rapamycin complex 2 subunit MAPKAP1 n=2 Tax=Frankliniella occidentalis TaxID=133901 RepID=A0A6J1SU70_FRAOC|nr:target of rapamycin complex 2 subunit MAPKAP1 isoform X1 [Frankliniella occidentalis]KAE8742580.1 hypothetical protein FOCC_FOCC011874 [Frankliniella occidentalis]
MAFYDNKHWLISHIRNSFVSSDDTGMCEMVMQGENLSKKLISSTKFDCYPGEDDSEDDDMDAMGQSFDIQSDLDFGGHRARSNTAARLEKMDREKKRAAKTKHIKWESAPAALSKSEMAEVFQEKDLKIESKPELKAGKSLLAQQLEKCPNLPQNPFQMFAKCDGSAHVGVKVKKYGIFLPLLPAPDCNYPMTVIVLAAAKVQDLIGLILYKCTIQHPNQKFKSGVESYALHIAEDDGEIDWDFPCLDPRETVGKFGFKFLALVESKGSLSSHLQEEFKDVVDCGPVHGTSGNKSKAQLQEAELRMKDHMTAMEASLYQSYQVHVLHPLRAKTEIHLGVSRDKVEIDPVTQQKVSAKFWVRQRAVSYDTDCIVACDLLETKSNNRAVFRMVYYRSSSPSPELSSATPHSMNFKHHDFEAAESVARAVVQQINHVLELRTSARRKEYLALKERRSHRRKSFHLGPR